MPSKTHKIEQPDSVETLRQKAARIEKLAKVKASLSNTFEQLLVNCEAEDWNNTFRALAAITRALEMVMLKEQTLHLINGGEIEGSEE